MGNWEGELEVENDRLMWAHFENKECAGEGGYYRRRGGGG